MKLYSAKLRLAGSIHNEVPLTNVTAAELEILNSIHGGSSGTPSVLDVTETGKTDVPQHRLRDELTEKYARGISRLKDASGNPRTFESMFGPRSLPLPEEWLAAAPADASVRPRKPKLVAEPAAPSAPPEPPKIDPAEFA